MFSPNFEIASQRFPQDRDSPVLPKKEHHFKQLFRDALLIIGIQKTKKNDGFLETERPFSIIGDIPNRYPLYKVDMGLIIKAPSIPRGHHHFPHFPQGFQGRSQFSQLSNYM